MIELFVLTFHPWQDLELQVPISGTGYIPLITGISSRSLYEEAVATHSAHEPTVPAPAPPTKFSTALPASIFSF